MTQTQKQTQSDLRYGTTQLSAAQHYAPSHITDQDAFPHIHTQPLRGNETVRAVFTKEIPEKMDEPSVHYNTSISASLSPPHGVHPIPTGHVSTTPEGLTVEPRNGSQRGFINHPVPFPQPPMPGDHAAAHMESDKALRAQENLQDAREDLLGFRFALRSQRKELTQLRQETGEVEGAIFSHIRQIFHDNHIPFPDQLVKNYHRARSLRDRLGFSEAQYDEEEQKYNGLEYEYTQKEGGFIDTLVSGISPPLHSVDRYHHNRETEDLTKFAEGPNGLGDSTISHPLELPNDPLSLPAVENDRISQIQNHEASKEFDTSGPPHSRVSTTETSYSLPQTPVVPNYRPRTRASVSKSESAMLDASKHWPDTLRRIDSWLLGTTICSPVHTTFLKNVHSEAGLKDPLWDLILAHWASTEYDTKPPPIDDSHISTDGISTSLGRDHITPVSLARPEISNSNDNEPIASRNITSLGQQAQRHTNTPEMEPAMSLKYPTYVSAVTNTTPSVPERSTDIGEHDARNTNN